MSFNPFQAGPNATAKTIKIIISLTIILTLITAVAPKYLSAILGLSYSGLKDGFFFQLFTNLFIIPDLTISLGFIFHLFFSCYLIWVFGSSIIDWKGNKHFIALFLLTGIISSLVAVYIMSLSSTNAVYFGSNAVLYALSMAWLMLHSDAKIFLFFTLPFKAKWLILGTMAINLLSLLSNEIFSQFFSYLSAAVVAYLYSLFIWQKQSPINFLKKAEQSIINFIHRKKLKKSKKEKVFHQSKIYDFETKKPILDDDDFMDSMLNRIALYGKEILTDEEKKRMDEIASKKTK